MDSRLDDPGDEVIPSEGFLEHDEERAGSLTEPRVPCDEGTQEDQGAGGCVEEDRHDTREDHLPAKFR